MLRYRLFWSLTALLALSVPGAARAQYLQPFIDPCAIDTEFQWFKPLYCECGEDYTPVRNGYFFAFDRGPLNISRPDQSPGDMNGDWTWGNRFDLGYMTDEVGGWSTTIWKIDSPGEFFVQDNVNRNGEILVDLLGDPLGPERNTINDMELYGIELNRSWRLQPTHRGAILEPLVGFRFIRVTDYFVQEDITTIREGAPVTGPANGSLALLNQDFFDRDEFKHANDMFGGQFGMRIITARGRWRLSSDIRGLAFNNFQDRDHRFLSEINERVDVANYDQNGNLQNITVGGVTLDEVATLDGDDVDRFVYGGELRLEAAFDVTQIFALRMGLELLALGDGVGRGFSGSDEAFVAAGLTMGFTLNR